MVMGIASNRYIPHGPILLVVPRVGDMPPTLVLSDTHAITLIAIVYVESACWHGRRHEHGATAANNKYLEQIWLPVWCKCHPVTPLSGSYKIRQQQGREIP